MASVSHPPLDAALLARWLPLSGRAANGRAPGDGPDVTWASAPALPSELTDAVARAWGVQLRSAADGRDPMAFAAFAAVYAQARAEQIVRALSARTNLVLPGARTVIVGGGAVAEALDRIVRRLGGRVLRAAADPVTRLRAHLSGTTVLDPDAATWPAVDYIAATGEGHSSLDPAALTAVAIDASPAGTGIRSAAGEEARPHVTRVGDRAWLVESPPPVGEVLGELSALEWHIADALIALSLLVAEAGTGAAVDERFARLVLA